MRKGIRTLSAALQEVRGTNIEIIRFGAVSHNAAQAIAHAAKALEVNAVIIGASRGSALYRMPRGQVLKGIMKRLTRNCHLVISN